MIATAQSSFQARPMIITAKYASACKVCQKQVLPGDRVEWVRGDKHVSHVQCTEEGQKLVAAVEASKAPVPTASGVAIPCPEERSYLPFQIAGVQHALTLPEGVLIADQQGLGKSIETCAFINASPDIRKILIVCPASARINWERECNKWLVKRACQRFALDPVTGRVWADVALDQVPEVTQWPLVHGDVVIVSFDLVGKLLEVLPGASWDLIVIDEVHLVKNPKTARHKNVSSAKKRAAETKVLALTGTPIPNKTVELFPILQLVAPLAWDPAGRAMRKENGKKVYFAAGPGEGAGFFPFVKRYSNAHKEERGKKSFWVWDGASNLDELNEKLRSTCMVRRLKKDVLKELPPKRRSIVCFPQDGAVDEVTGEARGLSEVLKAATLKEALAALESRKVSFEGYSSARVGAALAKVQLVVEHVRNSLESGSEKVIVFAHHKEVVSALEREFLDMGVVTVDGETPNTGDGRGTRTWAVDQFQDNPEVRVFVGTIGAAGVALTLTASDHVVFAELPLRFIDLEQAEDRTHRIGQHGSVSVDILVYDGSVDAHIARLLVEKQDVAEMALDKETIVSIEGRIDASAAPSYKEAREKAYKDAGLTKEECKELLSKMQFLAGMCDGAQLLDGHGFNKIDANIGHALADCRVLSPKQALCARKLAVKYRRQLEGRTWQ